MNFPRTLKHQQKQKLEQEYSDGGGVGGGGDEGRDYTRVLVPK